PRHRLDQPARPGDRYDSRITHPPVSFSLKNSAPGNEHAVRVNVSVVRRPQMTSAQELLARRLLLPALLVGFLPTTAQAQRFSSMIKADPAPDRVTGMISAWLYNNGQ
ncbi:hypothetical protein AB0J29_33605, partial [Nocardia sp. NPDC049707]